MKEHQSVSTATNCNQQLKKIGIRFTSSAGVLPTIKITPSLTGS